MKTQTLTSDFTERELANLKKMKTIEITLYSFDELEQDAQETALEAVRQLYSDDDWYYNTYEDASNVGLKITSFDLDRHDITGEFFQDALYTANLILKEHGQQCESFKTAEKFIADRDEVLNNAAKDENGDFEDEYQLDADLDECESDFLQSILEDYRIMLGKEYDYINSREYLLERIESEDFDFTESGDIN